MSDGLAFIDPARARACARRASDAIDASEALMARHAEARRRAARAPAVERRLAKTNALLARLFADGNPSGPWTSEDARAAHRDNQAALGRPREDAWPS